MRLIALARSDNNKGELPPPDIFYVDRSSISQKTLTKQVPVQNVVPPNGKLTYGDEVLTTNNVVKLCWNRVPDANGYRIHFFEAIEKKYDGCIIWSEVHNVYLNSENNSHIFTFKKQGFLEVYITSVDSNDFESTPSLVLRLFYYKNAIATVENEVSRCYYWLGSHEQYLYTNFCLIINPEVKYVTLCCILSCFFSKITSSSFWISL